MDMLFIYKKIKHKRLQAKMDKIDTRLLSRVLKADEGGPPTWLVFPREPVTDVVDANAPPAELEL